MFKLITLMIFLVSCVPEASKEDTSSKKTTQNDSPQTSDLVGTWQTDCENSNSPDQSYFLKFVFNNDGTSYFEENYFYGHDCQTSTKDTLWTSYFHYTEGTNDIDFTRTKVEMTPQHSDTVTDYNNSDGWCKQTDWSINTLEDVTNLDCDWTSPREVDTFLSSFDS